MTKAVTSEAMDRAKAFFQVGQSTRYQMRHSGALVNVPAYLDYYGIPYRTKSNGQGVIYCLENCLFDPSHGKNESSIIQKSDGTLLYQCFHNSCKGRTWGEARQIISADDSMAPFVENFQQPKNKTDIQLPAPLNPEQTSALKFIEKTPPPREYILQDILPKQIVGGIVAMGGLSKTFLLMTLAIGIATGKRVLRHFNPVQPSKVLGLFAEDHHDEIHRRVHHLANHIIGSPNEITTELLAHNLHLHSVAGTVKPIMKLEGNNPVPSSYFHWLRQTIEAHDGLEILIIDPKSRFYGLDENNNDHNTAWVSCLEELVRDYRLTVLFSHHVNKALSGSLNQMAARGGGALSDGVRWLANLAPLDDKKAASFGILENIRDYVMFDISKINYAPHLPRTIYFKRGNEGVLEVVNLKVQRLQKWAESLCGFIYETYQDEEITLTKRQILSQEEGKKIREQMKDKFNKFTRENMEETIGFALKKGMLTIQKIDTGSRPREVLMVEFVYDYNKASEFLKHPDEAGN